MGQLAKKKKTIDYKDFFFFFVKGSSFKNQPFFF